MTRSSSVRSVSIVLTLVAAICACLCADAAAAPLQQQVRPKESPVPVPARRLPTISSITPIGADGVPIIKPGKPFSIVGSGFPAAVTAITIELSSGPKLGKGGAEVSSPLKLRPKSAAADRIDVVAPVKFPSGLARCVVQVVTPAGRSNTMAARCGEEAPVVSTMVTLAGYVRDAAGQGQANIRVTAYDPAKPATYGARTSSAGRYELKAPKPFTGQVNVPEFDGCFWCKTGPRNLVNQSADLLDVDFSCVNTAIIAGKTLTSFNELIKGVRMDGLPGAPVTNDWADYQVNVPCGWSGTVAPYKYGWSFTPHTYTNLLQRQVQQNYIGGAISHSVTGYVRTSAGAGIAGVKLTGLYPRYPGESSVTDANGYYHVTVYHGWTGAATPTLAGYSFSPASRTYTKVESSQDNQNYVGSEASAPGAFAVPGVEDRRAALRVR